MAIRTTADEVKKLVEVDATVSTDLLPFIMTANAIVDDVCLTSSYTTERLELIERWLAAHFYTVRDPRLASEGVKSITASYQNKLGLMLASSHQGQTAMALDTKGNLAALSKKLERGQGGKLRVVALGCGEVEECES